MWTIVLLYQGCCSFVLPLLLLPGKFLASTMEQFYVRRKAIALYLLLGLLGGHGRRRMWVHPLNQRRREQGAFQHLVAELRLDGEKHIRYFRMTAEQMDDVLSMVGPDLTRQTTTFRAAIEPKQRLAITLRYLGTGESLRSLAFQYRLGKSTVGDSIHMTCKAIERRMTATQFPRPNKEMWEAIASKFWIKWNFPNCLGAIDRKHVTVVAPRKSGSMFFNYKRTFSIVLLALVDADYRFIFVQVGDFGRASDGGVYADSALGRGMEAKTLDVPEDCPLPGSGVQGPIPYAIVGDAAFPLKTYLMRPFPGTNIPKWRKVFNYRLSRARMVVECAFGILTSRWRVLHNRINMKIDNVDSVVMAACILHNYLVSPSQNQRWLNEAEEGGLVLPPAGNTGGHRSSRDAYAVREKLSAFFSSPEGKVSWQDRMV